MPFWLRYGQAALMRDSRSILWLLSSKSAVCQIPRPFWCSRFLTKQPHFESLDVPPSIAHSVTLTIMVDVGCFACNQFLVLITI